MKKLPFWKLHGLGNDFVLLNDLNGAISAYADRELSIKLCDRNFGIGGDGLIVLRKGSSRPYAMHFYNCDGSRGTFCGNGIRALAQWLSIHELSRLQNVFIETDAGVKEISYVEGEIEVDLGICPGFKKETASGKIYDTGTDHLVLWTNDVDTYPFLEKAPKLASQYQVNVNVASRLDHGVYKVRTFEKGVFDETLACGSGCAAVALDASKKFSCGRSILVETVRGGVLHYSFLQTIDGLKIKMRGPAKEVFSGSIDIREIAECTLEYLKRSKTESTESELLRQWSSSSS